MSWRSKPNSFRPLPLLGGAHRQTLAGHFLRGRLGWPIPTEDTVVETSDGARLLLRVSSQARSGSPTLLLVHGLEGSDRSSYILSTGALAYAQGWHVVRMNLRGCGDALRLCPRLYNAGLTSDLLAVLECLARRGSPIAICGFSLGANLTLVTLARHRPALSPLVRAAVAVCPPLDLSACADALERFPNRLYQTHFMGRLRESYRARQRLAPDRYAFGIEKNCRTLREYDDIITARYGGYSGVDDYYARSSSGAYLSDIDRPTLLLSAADDPMIPEGSLHGWQASPLVTQEVLRTGGHVGFVGRSAAPGRFWAAERAIRFATSAIASSSKTRGARDEGVRPRSARS